VARAVAARIWRALPYSCPYALPYAVAWPVHGAPCSMAWPWRGSYGVSYALPYAIAYSSPLFLPLPVPYAGACYPVPICLPAP